MRISPDTKANIQNLASANVRERTEAACWLGKARAVAAIPGFIQLLSECVAGMNLEQIRWRDFNDPTIQ